jgi:hypothetical protein
MRIGYSDSRLLPAVARAGRRFLRVGSGEAMRARAAGASPDSHSTRRGALGWSWALVVTVNYVWQARRMVRRVRGSVLVNDRALPDAIVGLKDGYGGAVDVGLHARLLERLAPRPDLTVYMRIAPEVALARKEDIFAGRVIEEHARAYDRLFESRSDTVVMDAELPIEDIRLELLRLICERAATA